jgi:non-specific serine/threonine protein kinase
VQVRNWSLEQLPCFQEYEHAGQDLASWAAAGHLRPMQFAERLQMLLGIAATVAAAHNVGVLHRALTPGNLLVSRVRSTWQVKLGDFGSSRLLDSVFLKRGKEPDATSIPRSTYLAPELRDGQPMTQKSEVYALGIILHQLVAGDFSKPLEPVWGADLDPALCDVITHATCQNPARRTATVEALIKRLRTCCPAAASRALPLLRLVPTAGMQTRAHERPSTEGVAAVTERSRQREGDAGNCHSSPMRRPPALWPSGVPATDSGHGRPTPRS